MQKILITGTGGFIFSNFVRNAIFQKKPYNFVSIDKVKEFNILTNIYNNKNHQFYIADTTDPHIIEVIFEFEKPDIVIHAAAETHVDNSIKNPNEFILSNVLGTQIITNACVKYGIKKLVYISTDEVYGSLNDNDPLWTEESTLGPRNPYSASKLSGELIVQAASSTFGLNYNIVRPCNNYGLRQDPSKLVPKVIKCILNNEKIPVYGQGLQIRDWLYVIDNCDAIMTVVEKGGDKQIYNVSANQEYSNIEIIQEICNVLNKGHNLISFVEDRKGHDYRYGLDSSKIKKLGWAPTVKFKDGIRKTVDWYLNNKWILR